MNFYVINNKKYYLLLVVFSFYLILYSVLEFPYIDFIYKSSFMALNEEDGLVYTFINAINKSILFIYAICIIKIISVFFMLFDRIRFIAALIVLFSNLVLINISQNIATSPELRYVNLLILIIVLYPKHFNLNNNEKLEFSSLFTNIIWFVFGLSYSISGYFKLISPDWFSGNFLNTFLKENHNVNEFFLFLSEFPQFLKLSTFFGMFIELTALPLVLFSKTRFFALLNLTLLQMGLLFLADVYQITLGMLVFHLFMFLILFQDQFKSSIKPLIVFNKT